MNKFFTNYKKAWEEQLGRNQSELQKENQELKAENARFREALQNIAFGDIPIGNQSQHIPLTRRYEDYADAVLHEVK